jgi:hypothetical protein
VVWRTKLVRPRLGTGSDGRMPRCASTRMTPAVPASITSSLKRWASPPSYTMTGMPRCWHASRIEPSRSGEWMLMGAPNASAMARVASSSRFPRIWGRL